MDDREKRKRLRRLKRRIRRLSWFPSYQSFSELGIKGRRNDSVRYRYLDFTDCSDSIVADYGCNIGQTAVKAAKAGAKMVYGFDSQADSIEVAKEIGEILNLDNLEFYRVDFNDPDYQEKILNIFNGEYPDISFFLSVYRTKELKDRDGLFKFIIEHTKNTIYFEGHSVKSIDTVDFYMDLFKRFGLRAEFLGYSQGETRPFFKITL